jgi:hypothetical protein
VGEIGKVCSNHCEDGWILIDVVRRNEAGFLFEQDILELLGHLSREKWNRRRGERGRRENRNGKERGESIRESEERGFDEGSEGFFESIVETGRRRKRGLFDLDRMPC